MLVSEVMSVFTFNRLTCATIRNGHEVCPPKSDTQFSETAKMTSMVVTTRKTWCGACVVSVAYNKVCCDNKST